MSQIKKKLEYIKIDDLIFYEKNARTHSDDQIEQIIQSIKEFGFTNPVLIDENNVLIAGHGRTAASKKMGLKEVPAIRLTGLTEYQIKALRIADNKLALNAGWDEELLQFELGELQSVDYNLDLLGFSLDEIESILQNDNSFLPDDIREEIIDESDVDEDNVEARCKAGDIWKLGRHRLMCGDSTKLNDVKKLMNGAKANLLITDPPYNVNYQGGTKDRLSIVNDDMDSDSFRLFLKSAFICANEVMKDGSVFYIWHGENEGYNFRGACNDIGWEIRQCLIWNKNSLVVGRQDYQWKHEPCLYGWKSGASHLWTNDRKQTTIIDYDRPTKSEYHPTMKPVGLFDYQIKNNSNEGDIVLDLFGGSGTTIIACEYNMRDAYSMEIDEHYCDVILTRWEELTGNKAERILNVA